jgi:hypothetical protein
MQHSPESIVISGPGLRSPGQGANPTLVSYSASIVKIYSAAYNLVHFETKSIFFCFERLLHRWNCT